MVDNHNALQINIDTSGIDRAKEHLQHIKGGAQTAVKAAINKAAIGIKTDAGRETSKAFAVDSDTVKKRMWVTKATDSSMSAEVGRRGPRFFARNFPRTDNPSPGRRGTAAVFLRPRRDGGGWFLNEERGLSKAFVATLPGRGRGVYRRIIGKVNSDGGRSSLIHARGLSVPEMLSDAFVRQTIEANATKRLNEELDRQVDRLLSKGATL